jgi:mannose-6-phosphate isomerase-like protein (cupin superfamily)
VQSGTLEYSWDGGSLIMGAGDTLTVPVGLMHAFRNPSSADAIAFVIRGAAAPAAPTFADNRVAAE